MLPELKQKLVEFHEKDENSWIILGNKEKRGVCGKHGEKILEYSLRILFSLFNARLFHKVVWDTKFFHCSFYGGEKGLGENLNMFYTRSGSLYIACSSSNMAQNKNKSLSFSSNAEADDFNFIGFLNTMFQFLCCLFRLPFHRWLLCW